MRDLLVDITTIILQATVSFHIKEHFFYVPYECVPIMAEQIDRANGE